MLKRYNPKILFHTFFDIPAQIHVWRIFYSCVFVKIVIRYT